LPRDRTEQQAGDRRKNGSECGWRRSNGKTLRGGGLSKEKGKASIRGKAQADRNEREVCRRATSRAEHAAWGSDRRIKWSRGGNKPKAGLEEVVIFRRGRFAGGRGDKGED